MTWYKKTDDKLTFAFLPSADIHRHIAICCILNNAVWPHRTNHSALVATLARGPHLDSPLSTCLACNRDALTSTHAGTATYVDGMEIKGKESMLLIRDKL